MLMDCAPTIGVPGHQTWFFILLALLVIVIILTAIQSRKGVTMMVIHNVATNYFVNFTSGLVVGAQSIS